MLSAKSRNKSTGGQIFSFLTSDLGILLVAALIILAVYAIDTVRPLGEPVWLLYLIPLVLSYWSDRYYAIPAVFIAITLFLVAGFLLSPQGIAVNYAILMRFSFFLIFFIAALLLWWVRRKQITEERL